MKTIYISIFVLFLCFSVNAQIITIPDAYFKNVLVTTACVQLPNQSYDDVDTNNDGEIQLSEALAVTKLDISDRGLTNISGVENFTNLTYLSCASNALGGELNVSMLTNLTDLECSNCQLTSLNVDGLTHLTRLYAFSNNFTVLDLSNTAVVDFYLGGCTSLQYLNIKNGFTTYNCAILLDGSYSCHFWAGCNALQMVCADEEELQYTIAVPNSGTVVTTYCSFEPGGGYNTITGNVTLDCGGTNISAVNQNISISNGTITGGTAVNGNGQYHFYPGLGTHVVSLPASAASLFNITPPAYSFNFTTTGNTQTANFCLTPNGVHPDLEVALFPMVGPRPGFDAMYYIIYKNKGNQVQSGSVQLVFEDAILDYISAIPTITSQATNQLTWGFTNLMPFESRGIYVTLNVNSPQETPAVNNGDILHYQAIVNSALTDETPTDNTMNYNQTVLGSYDPNDKTVVQGTQIGLSQTGDYLNYIVRFQNTGTAAAENVVIKDMLSDKLEWSTLQMVSSSHPYRYTLTSGNKLEVFYQNINLPATIDDEPGSHGYIAFKIKPKSTVVLNDAIQNRASIYFDFNFPIITNMVTTTVSNLGIDGHQNSNLFSVYPNPTSGIVNIAMAANQSITKATITNLLGQNILTSGGTTIDISSLNKGTYFITVETEKGKQTQRIIKL
ncbi:MAG: T9SS type A sorting domain-containing protein [Flavobacterium sp. JAD_PAG50586_2]|nr:MAG: T9SS type A sorting domain-containing protein [Flavobacterium sp. JAD_PAG50586_2]